MVTIERVSISANPQLRFDSANAKLERLIDYLEKLWGKRVNVYSLSLPAGYSCPFADECLSKSDRETGKITDGPNNQFRCFMASTEAYSKDLRTKLWENYTALRNCKSVDEMVALIEASFPVDADIIRAGVDGDYYNQMYFDAWLQVMRNHPDVMFYGYTKSLPYWVARLDNMPPNFNLTASRGGKADHLINEYSLKSSTVVLHPRQAAKLGLEIDHDETHALFGDVSFALLIHGTQPAGSESSKALSTLKREGISYSYSKSSNRKTKASS